MGLIFVVFGLNGFLHFIPQPEMSPEGAAFLGHLIAMGLFPIVKGIEVLAGLMILSGLLVPLGLLLLAPLIVVIVYFHVLIEPSGLPIAIGVLLFEIFLAWRYKQAWRDILSIGTAPANPG